MADVTKASAWHSKPKGTRNVTRQLKLIYRIKKTTTTGKPLEARRAGDQLAAAPSREQKIPMMAAGGGRAG